MSFLISQITQCLEVQHLQNLEYPTTQNRLCGFSTHFDKIQPLRTKTKLIGSRFPKNGGFG